MLRDGGGKAISILNSIEINLDELRKKVELLNPAIIDSSTIKLDDKKNLNLTRQAERALKATDLEAKLFKRTNINITFGKPIFSTKEDKKNLSELTKKTMEAIRKMLPEEYC